MSKQQQELYNIIKTLPDELSYKAIDYIEYLKFTYVINNINAPADLIIRSEDDLIQKIEKGIKSTDSGKAHSIDETMSIINSVLAQ